MSTPNFLADGPNEFRRESECDPDTRNSIAVKGKEALRWIRSIFPPVEAI